MYRKGQGRKTYSREGRLFSANRSGMTESDKINLKVISMSNDVLKKIIENPEENDRLIVSFAKEEYARREFNKAHNLADNKLRRKLNNRFPEHKHMTRKWKKKK